MALTGAVLLAGCRELPRYFSSNTTLARVGARELHVDEVQRSVPAGVSGEDSAAFVRAFTERWIRRQVKLQEAEVLFSASAADIERQVEEYRQELLIRKLEQHHVDLKIDTVFTEEEIAAYYQSHKSDFRLDRAVVKGLIVRCKEGDRQARKLKKLMAAAGSAQKRELEAICEKQGFTLNDFTGSWIDFPEFLCYLPALRSQNYDPVLRSKAVQEMRDSKSHYYFRIDEVRHEGETIPIERVRPMIRRILFNQRIGEITRALEEELYTRGVQDNRIKCFLEAPETPAEQPDAAETEEKKKQ